MSFGRDNFRSRMKAVGEWFPASGRFRGMKLSNLLKKAENWHGFSNQGLCHFWSPLEEYEQILNSLYGHA